MNKLILFIVRYLVSAAASLALVPLGLLPRYRAALYEAAYQLGWRKRPHVESGLPPLEIPDAAASEIATSNLDVTVLEPDAANGNVSGYELLVMAGIVRRHAPKTCFEIGTFDGRTTMNLVANMPDDGHVYTLDLPPSGAGSTALKVAAGDEQFIEKDESGARFKGSPLASRITQLWGDSASFDYTPYEGRMDLVFVDGAHSYDYVIKDTDTALRLVKPGGVILWHDYGSPYWKGLTRAMNELYAGRPGFSAMRHIRGTTLVYWRREGTL